MSDWTPTSPPDFRRAPWTPTRDLNPPPKFPGLGPDADVTSFGGYPRSRRRERKQRTWPGILLGALAAYGLFSLVLHAVVIYEVTR